MVPRGKGSPDVRDRLSSILLGIFLLAGCRSEGPAPTQPEAGGTLHLAVMEPFDFLTPVRAIRPATEQFLVHVTPPLGRVTEQGDVQWLMARRPSFMDPGLLFHLRPARWEDGQPVIASDFTLTVEMMLHPGAPGHERSRFGLVQDVVALDDTTLYFELLTLARERWRDALLMPLPRHVLGDHPDPRHLQEWPISQKPLACGPFRVSESSTYRLVLERNEGAAPFPVPWVERVVVVSLEADEALQRFRAGELDVVDDLPFEAVENLKSVPGAQLKAFVGASYVYVGWNLRDARFADLAVRRAAAMAVDTKKLIRELTLGQGDPARGPLVPALGFADTTALLPYDPEAAKSLLTEAGWVDGDGDGVRDRKGARLAFHLLVPEQDPLRQRTAEAVAQQLRLVGMEVHVRVLLLEEFYGRLNRGEFEAYVGKWVPQRGMSLEAVWHSEATDRFNYGGFRNATVDSLLAFLRLEQPGPSEEELLLRLQRTIYAAQPYLFLFQDPRFALFSPRVQGERPNVLSSFWNLPEWWIPAARRRPEGRH